MRQVSARRRLIDLDGLACALQWSPFAAEVAAELDIDVPTFQARLVGLDAGERAHLEQLLVAAADDNDDEDLVS